MEVSASLRVGLCQLTAGLDWLTGGEVWRRHKSIDISMTMVMLRRVENRRRRDPVYLTKDIETFVVPYTPALKPVNPATS